MNSRINELYDFAKKHHANASAPKVESDQLKLADSFNVTLRQYQEDAVVWMLSRERSPAVDISYEGIQLVYPKGGILADEMGLGKTIEMLACILCNPSPFNPTVDNSQMKPQDVSVDSNVSQSEMKVKGAKRKRKIAENAQSQGANEEPTPKKRTGLFSSKFDSLRAWYEQSLSGNTPTKRYRDQNQSNSKLRCFCNNDSERVQVILCKECDTEQHKECVGSPSSVEEYFCPWCWTKQSLIKTGATLIVSPASISSQWMDEIKQRVKNTDLSVVFYEGVKSRKYMQPRDLANYDIVVTSYQVLCTELSYVWEEESARKLRHAKRYFAPASPLTCVKWWRLVLDEAQMVEGSTTKTAEMACRLLSVNKWAVSGTPIQKNIEDLYGLLKFLNVEPFSSDQKKWLRLIENEERCFTMLAPIIWRSIKKDVFDQIGVPPQTAIHHWLRFSPVEGYFYQRIHKECADLFNLRLNTLVNPDETRIKDIDRSQLNKLLNPLLKLRQACTHPQVIRGKYMKLKRTLTMEELMTDMVGKAKIDLISALRAVVSALNGLAGVNWVNFNYEEAIECYRKILLIGREYEYLVKIDSLQMIHTLHNLAEALEDHGAGLPKTLRDSQLRQEALALEDYYLKKTEEQMNIAKAQTSKLTELVDEIANGRPLGYSAWWEDLLREIREDGELLNRITTYLEDNKVFGQTNLSHRVQSLPAALRVLAIWFADTDVARLDAMDSVKHLHTTPKDVLSNEAVDCHLTSKKKQKKKKKKKVCTLCSSSDLLKKYESLIFSITEDTKDEELYESEEENDGEGGYNKLLADLKEVELFSKKKEGNWKPSLQEGVLRVLASYVRGKKIRDDWSRDANKHLLLLGAVKKEFKSLRAEWQKISNLVAAKDEISMAKMRLRLPTPEEELGLASTSIKTKKTVDVVNIIHPHEVPYQTTLLESDLASGQNELKRTAGILVYLKNLQKNGQIENDPCPVCQDKLNDKWSVLQCGHCVCFDCIPTLLKMNHGVAECPMCRLRTPRGEVSFVVANQSVNGLPLDEARLCGSYSTKVEAVTLQLLHLRNKDPDVKVIIFSTWEKVLDVISEALGANSVSFRRMGSHPKHRNGLSQFKTSPVTALLIPLSRGSKGLNIIEATHIFLVEPILNPADELQAVGRVHRIGQTKPTFIHHFTVHNTVEEQMAISVDPDGWADGNVTVSELLNLFTISESSESSPQTALGEVLMSST